MSEELKTRRMLNYCRHVKDSIHANIENWNKVVTALDLIDDTLHASEFYLEQDKIDGSGAGYIFIYGAIQALYIQQDADAILTRALNDSLSLKLSPVKDLPRVKEMVHPV